MELLYVILPINVSSDRDNINRIMYYKDKINMKVFEDRNIVSLYTRRKL